MFELFDLGLQFISSSALDCLFFFLKFLTVKGLSICYVDNTVTNTSITISNYNVFLCTHSQLLWTINQAFIY